MNSCLSSAELPEGRTVYVSKKNYSFNILYKSGPYSFLQRELFRFGFAFQSPFDGLVGMLDIFFSVICDDALKKLKMCFKRD